MRLLNPIPALIIAMALSAPCSLHAQTAVECGSSLDGTLVEADPNPFADGSRQDRYLLYVRNLPADVTVEMSTPANTWETYVALIDQGNHSVIQDVRGLKYGAPASLTVHLDPGAYLFYVGSYATLPAYPQTYHVTINCDYIRPVGSSDPDTVLANLNATQWHGYGLAPTFSDPAFQYIGGLFAFVGDPTYTFGFFQNHTAMTAPPAGTYLLQANITPNQDLSGGQRHPECRFRVLRDNNTFSWMADVPELTSNAGYINPLRIYWVSDGTTPWRIAVDMLAFSSDVNGGWTVSNMTNTLVSATTTPPPEAPPDLPAPGRSTNPATVLGNLNANYWDAVSITSIFTAPAFSESGGLGMTTPNPANTFGFWQTRDTLTAPAAGAYWLRLTVNPSPTVAGKRHPELRVRVFRGDNLYSQMGDAVETAPGQGFPTTITVPWYSDGSTPWRIALDMLSFAPDITGGYTITAITNTRIP